MSPPHFNHKGVLGEITWFAHGAFSIWVQPSAGLCGPSQGFALAMGHVGTELLVHGKRG